MDPPLRHGELKQQWHPQQAAEKQASQRSVHCAFYQITPPWKNNTETLVKLLWSTQLQDVSPSHSLYIPRTYHTALHILCTSNIYYWTNKLLTSFYTTEFNTSLHIPLCCPLHFISSTILTNLWAHTTQSGKKTLHTKESLGLSLCSTTDLLCDF